VHRTYDGTNAPVRINWFRDRVEIQNPGGLYGHVTPENYRRVTDYRNPVLAEAMKVLGYVERFGVGIARAEAALRGNGHPPPEFVFEATHVLVTVQGRRWQDDPRLSPRPHAPATGLPHARGRPGSPGESDDGVLR
jgi:ATP-dependent DNA helicase RecG